MDGGPGAKRTIEGRHHEQQPGVQSAFLKDVQSLTVMLQNMGNPFLEEINDLLVLDTKDIMESVAVTVRKVETIGQDQHSKFVDERLSKCVTSVSDPLPKNKLPLFSRPAMKAPSKGKLQLQSMKSDCNLFYMWLDRQEMVMWISSSPTKIMLAHHLCHREENCGLAQRQI